jgi:hypothetical protein
MSLWMLHWKPILAHGLQEALSCASDAMDLWGHVSRFNLQDMAVWECLRKHFDSSHWLDHSYTAGDLENHATTIFNKQMTTNISISSFSCCPDDFIHCLSGISITGIQREVTRKHCFRFWYSLNSISLITLGGNWDLRELKTIRKPLRITKL